MNWLVALIVTALLWQRDWALALAAGAIIATLLGIEGALCDLQYKLTEIEKLLKDKYDGWGARLPMSAMRGSFLGQGVVTPRTVTAWRLRRALGRENGNHEVYNSQKGRETSVESTELRAAGSDDAYRIQRLRESLDQARNDR